MESSGSPAPSQPGPHKPIRRRMRMITSCLECRRRKLKCDKSQPCGHCLRGGRECLYMGPQLDEASQLRLTQFKDTVGSLEKQLERNVVSSAEEAKTSREGSAEESVGRGNKAGGPLVADEVGEYGDETAGLQPADIVNLDVTYEDDADGGADDVVDLGVLVGKMRITERIGGIARPRLAEEVQAGIAGQPTQPPLGKPPPPQPPQPQGTPSSQQYDMPEFWPGMPIESWPDFLQPGESYIPPSSSIMLGPAASSPSSSNTSLSLENLLPTRPAADRLLQQYFEAVHPIARCVHGPSLQADYADFWNLVWENVEPRPSLQALIFAALFSAAVSMDDDAALREFGRSHRNLVETLKLGVETALSKSNFLRTTRVQTLQAFVMYMIPLCRDEVSRAHSVLVGSAIRMAECMGLHRDGSTYGLNALDTHIRRLIWHQLCFLDIRTSEAQGPRPSIRRDDYDTRLPLNVDDDQFIDPNTGGIVPFEPRSQTTWTSMLLPLIRFEINEMMRIIWLDRRRLESRTITLTKVLSKVEAFRKSMLSKYAPFLDDNVPVQRYARLVMNLLLYRLHAMVLPMFHAPSSPNSPHLPPKLNRVLVTAGIMILEIGIQLETNPLFRPWSWYRGAYHQFQIALLLASELYAHPRSLDADRVWPCLDYVFNTDRSLSREQRTVQILGELVSKMAAYHRLRKARAPVQTTRAVLQYSANKPVLPPGPTSQPQYPPQTLPSQSQQTFKNYQVPTSAPQPPPQRAPPPNAVYAGISDGQTLWSAPLQQPSYPGTSSDEDSPLPSGPGGVPAPGVYPTPTPTTSSASAPGGPLGGDIEVDWDVVNGLFDTGAQTGELAISGFGDASLGMDWQYWGW